MNYSFVLNTSLASTFLSRTRSNRPIWNCSKVVCVEHKCGFKCNFMKLTLLSRSSIDLTNRKYNKPLKTHARTELSVVKIWRVTGKLPDLLVSFFWLSSNIVAFCHILITCWPLRAISSIFTSPFHIRNIFLNQKVFIYRAWDGFINASATSRLNICNTFSRCSLPRCHMHNLRPVH